ncbi:putative transcription factor [Filobasidium floriforme]|uniref:putative transcription factor n=1 Tax=Filobasidium floriforme TaxID=5210 RepID=UPI001E8E9FB2|nr:putative transcription factor [Filobasidium floriforme]KAH8079615.1 putative transcription factor [Filobasidium floriforme]
MYTTACDHCRRLRIKCVRQHEGRIPDEVCEACLQSETPCTTTKRKVGRQVGSKNKRPRFTSTSSSSVTTNTYTNPRPSSADRYYAGLPGPSNVTTTDAGHLPNPLHVLASEAYHRDADEPPGYDHPFRDSTSILDGFPEWSTRICGGSSTGRAGLLQRIDRLLAHEQTLRSGSGDDGLVFHGRVDMARPDAAPEDDVISLQIISLPDAQHLFDSFMNLLTNGSMYFDPRIHTLPYIRSHSSFLLCTILTISSSFRPISPSPLLHSRLVPHLTRLEHKIRTKGFKSIEIIQALLLLASWSEVPVNLARDKTWTYISHALALAVELRLDTPVPYYVQVDPGITVRDRELFIRNAHRCCMLLYIHDRNMAMVAGRYPIFPESPIFSESNLASWGKHPQAYRFDASLCASVTLRKLVNAVRHGLDLAAPVADSMAVIDESLDAWRQAWQTEISSTKEYDIIARFSAFVLVMTLVQRQQQTGRLDLGSRRYYETVAFEVCCAAIDHYTSWPGLLNSATFDTSMVTYCALCIVQSIGSSPANALSDWSLLRLATLQELVSLLEAQAAGRHQVPTSIGTNVVDAMARRLSREISLVLAKTHTSHHREPHPSTSRMPITEQIVPQDWWGGDLRSTQETTQHSTQNHNGNVGGLFLSDSAWQELLDQTQEEPVPMLSDAELEAIVAGLPSFDLSWWAM